MNWIDGPMVGFDLETTGVSVENDRVVTACVALMPEARRGPDGAVLPRPPQVWSWLADPGIEIPKDASDIHGITTEHAREHGADVAEVVAGVTGMLAMFLAEGVPVVGANLQYDLTLLDRECRRHGVVPLIERGPVAPIIDVMVIDKAADPYRPGGRKLFQLAEHYRVKLDGAHDSTADALAALRIAWRMAQAPVPRTPPRNGKPDREPWLDVGAMKLSDLHDAQVGWKATQAAGLARYLRGKGEDASGVRPQWPFIPVEPPPVPRDDVLFDI